MNAMHDVFREWGTQMSKQVAGPIRLSEPFFGLGGMAELLDRMGLQVELVNSFELDDEIASWHSMLPAAPNCSFCSVKPVPLQYLRCFLIDTVNRMEMFEPP